VTSVSAGQDTHGPIYKWSKVSEIYPESNRTMIYSTADHTDTDIIAGLGTKTDMQIESELIMTNLSENLHFSKTHKFFANCHMTK